jgi:hypothetical protein
VRYTEPVEPVRLTRISDTGKKQERFDTQRVAQHFLWPGETFREIQTSSSTSLAGARRSFTYSDEFIAMEKTLDLSERERRARMLLMAVSHITEFHHRHRRMVVLLRQDRERKRMTRYLTLRGAADLIGKLYRRVDALLGPTRPVDPQNVLCAEMKEEGFSVPEIVDLLRALSKGRCTCARPRCDGCGSEKLVSRGVEKADARAVQRGIDRARELKTRPMVDSPGWSPDERRTLRAAMIFAVIDINFLSPIQKCRLLIRLDLLDRSDPEDAVLLALPAVETRL